MQIPTSYSYHFLKRSPQPFANHGQMQQWFGSSDNLHKLITGILDGESEKTFTDTYVGGNYSAAAIQKTDIGCSICLKNPITESSLIFELNKKGLLTGIKKPTGWSHEAVFGQKNPDEFLREILLQIQEHPETDDSPPFKQTLDRFLGKGRRVTIVIDENEFVTITHADDSTYTVNVRVGDFGEYAKRVKGHTTRVDWYLLTPSGVIKECKKGNLVGVESLKTLLKKLLKSNTHVIAQPLPFELLD